MSKVYRIGIIGCGGIANGKHLPSLSRLKNVELVAFCDIVLERAEEAAGKYGIQEAKVYSDYKELLQDQSIDIIHVLTLMILMPRFPLLRLKRENMSCARSRWPKRPPMPSL